MAGDHRCGHRRATGCLLRLASGAGTLMGCRVCGAGLDYSWGPEWVAIKPGTCLISTQLDWMVTEYLCIGCHGWAKQHGALWDGVLRFKFDGFKVPNFTSRLAYGRAQVHGPARLWHLYSETGS